MKKENAEDINLVTYQAAFYVLFTVFQLAMIGIAGWTLDEVIIQGKKIARIEEHLSIPDLGNVTTNRFFVEVNQRTK